MKRRNEVFRILCKQCIGFTEEKALCLRPQSKIPACEDCKLRTSAGCFCLQEPTSAELDANQCRRFQHVLHKSKPSILKEDK